MNSVFEPEIARIYQCETYTYKQILKWTLKWTILKLIVVGLMIDKKQRGQDTVTASNPSSLHQTL